jgi:hypothetical protein
MIEHLVQNSPREIVAVLVQRLAQEAVTDVKLLIYA